MIIDEFTTVCFAKNIQLCAACRCKRVILLSSEHGGIYQISYLHHSNVQRKFYMNGNKNVHCTQYIIQCTFGENWMGRYILK